ncbi:hypothetical protein D9M71_681060 [compost metagenome]
MQVGGAEFLLLDMGEVLERADDALDPVDAIFRLVDQCFHVAADVVVLQVALELAQLVQIGGAIHRIGDLQQGADVAVEGLKVGKYVADGVVDLVRHPGGQLANGRQLLRLQQLAVGGFQLA